MLEVIHLPQRDGARPRQRDPHRFPQRNQARPGFAHRRLVAFLEHPDKLVELAGNQLGGFMDVDNLSLSSTAHMVREKMFECAGSLIPGIRTTDLGHPKWYNCAALP